MSSVLSVEAFTAQSLVMDHLYMFIGFSEGRRDPPVAEAPTQRTLVLKQAMIPLDN